MTRYTVVWSSPALDQLAQLWLEAGERSAVNAAAQAIDRQLAADPDAKGEAVHEGLRAVVEPPLYALYTDSEPDRMVRVLRVRPHLMPVPVPRTNTASPSVN